MRSFEEHLFYRTLLAGCFYIILQNIILFFFGNQENSAIQANDSADVFSYALLHRSPFTAPWVFT